MIETQDFIDIASLFSTNEIFLSCQRAISGS